MGIEIVRLGIQENVIIGCISGMGLLLVCVSILIVNIFAFIGGNIGYQEQVGVKSMSGDGGTFIIFPICMLGLVFCFAAAAFPVLLWPIDVMAHSIYTPFIMLAVLVVINSWCRVVGKNNGGVEENGGGVNVCGK